MPRAANRDVPILPPEVTWSQAISDYVMFRRTEGRAANTLKLERGLLQRLAKWASSQGVDVKAFALEEAEGFVRGLDQQVTPRGANLTIQAARSFGDWLTARQVWRHSFFRTIPTRREANDKRPRGLRPDQLEKLLAAPDRRKASGLRDFLALYLMSFVGLRVSEVCALRLSDLDTEDCRLRVRGETAKTRRERWPWLPHDRDRLGRRMLKAELSEPLRRWLLIRESMGLGPEGPLFCNVSRHPGHGEQGTALHPHQLQLALARYGRKAIGRRVNPHALRHTCGYLLGKQGMTIQGIQDQLGHVSLPMALLYSRGTEEDVGDAYAAADVTSAVKLPTRSRPKVLQPRDLANAKTALDALAAFGLTKEDLRAALVEEEGED